ncbi:hypothetical protein Pcinc_042921 [Petrolisthes cinctipes]|uniref:Uncharacterized protein n=1 Tax=Petrolisthes cinctipes TaxID=88211 RepID=A0AAE1BIK8_PETCI|nr:hypothetical protein Pcinc_042921 [Petrolisthes cinctipes]
MHITNNHSLYLLFSPITSPLWPLNHHNVTIKSSLRHHHSQSEVPRDGCLSDPSRSFKRPDVAATGPRGGVVQDASRSRSRGQRAIRGLNEEEEGDSRGQPPTRQEGREEDELQCYRKWLEERHNIAAAGIGVGGAVTRVTSFIYFFQELTGGRRTLLLLLVLSVKQ